MPIKSFIVSFRNRILCWTSLDRTSYPDQVANFVSVGPGHILGCPLLSQGDPDPQMQKSYLLPEKTKQNKQKYK